jgi:HAD superfamily hydrolase (TIGR01509 family)
MDGTLVDTEPYWISSETTLVERFGGTWTHEDALGLVGSDLLASARILQRAGVGMEAEAIVEHLTDRVIEQIRVNGVPFRPGAGIKTAIVTMSRHRLAERVTDLIEFDAFDAVLGGDDVPRPKPFPDPYLAGAGALGVAIEDCVAIEDSTTGLKSAVSAGAVSLGVPNLVSLEGYGAHAIWNTLVGRTADDIANLWKDNRA